jgi:transposase
LLRLQAFKFELQPNGEQLRNLRQFAGSCRFVYNKGLALNLERCEKKEKRLGYAGLCALLPNWKMEHERTPTSFKNELTFRCSRRKVSERVSEFRKASR